VVRVLCAAAKLGRSAMHCLWRPRPWVWWWRWGKHATLGAGLQRSLATSEGLHQAVRSHIIQTMDSAHHTRQDLMSLRLTEAAVAAIGQEPALVQRVLATLDHWDRVAPRASQGLRDSWRSIVVTGNWPLALQLTGTGQALRQASPLGKALQPQQRLAIIRACKSHSSNT
jgi:hypothetical protein